VLRGSGISVAKCKGVAPLIFLGLAVLCGLIARILLITSAFGISKKWGFGVFLPFGPMFFRRHYPDEVRRARKFQLATLPCIFIYVIISPELIPSTQVGLTRIGPPGQQKYALVAGSHTFAFGGYAKEAPAKKQPSLAERRQANGAEFERLRLWSEKLRLRKRDLLNADEQGALAYNRDANDYNAALDKANAEKFALAVLSQ
jgi:hypothetical protein